jgi:hypothetical protein
MALVPIAVAVAAIAPIPVAITVAIPMAVPLALVGGRRSHRTSSISRTKLRRWHRHRHRHRVNAAVAPVTKAPRPIAIYEVAHAIGAICISPLGAGIHLRTRLLDPCGGIDDRHRAREVASHERLIVRPVAQRLRTVWIHEPPRTRDTFRSEGALLLDANRPLHGRHRCRTARLRSDGPRAHHHPVDRRLLPGLLPFRFRFRQRR